MSNIKDLPGAGNTFRVSTGAGNFTKKFTAATRAGNLHNLADNKTSILRVIKKNEGVIKMGKFDRLRQLSAMKEVKKMEGARLTKDDKKEIKQLFKHLGNRAGAEDNKPQVKIQMQKDLDESYEQDRLNKIKAKVGVITSHQTTGEAKLNFASDPGFTKEKTDREAAKPDYKEVKQNPEPKKKVRINKELAEPEEEDERARRFNYRDKEDGDNSSNAIINRVLNRHIKPRSDIIRDRLSPKIFEPTKAKSYVADENKKDRRASMQAEKDSEDNKEQLNPEFFQNL